MISALFYFVLANFCFAGTFDAPVVWERKNVLEEKPDVWFMNTKDTVNLRELSVSYCDEHDTLKIKSDAGCVMDMRIDRGDLCKGRDIFRVTVINSDASKSAIGTVYTSSSQVLKSVCLCSPDQSVLKETLALESTKTPVIVSYDVQKERVEVRRFLGVSADGFDLFMRVSVAYNNLGFIAVDIGQKVRGLSYVKHLNVWKVAYAS